MKRGKKSHRHHLALAAPARAEDRRRLLGNFESILPFSTRKFHAKNKGGSKPPVPKRNRVGQRQVIRLALSLSQNRAYGPRTRLLVNLSQLVFIIPMQDANLISFEVD